MAIQSGIPDKLKIISKLPMRELEKNIEKVLTKKPGLLARELAEYLNVSRKEVNQALYVMPNVTKSIEHRWSLILNGEYIMNEELQESEQLQADNPELSEEHSNSIAAMGKKFAYDSLEALRKRLLDLTNRNALLHYRHPKNCIRLIDELPDQIYNHLQGGNKFVFIPVPEPTERELLAAKLITFDAKEGQKTVDYPTAEKWAKQLGYSTSYDLPEQKGNAASLANHTDSYLQTLFYPPELESRLRNIRSAAEGATEESGSNILYLVLGFLEWYENRESDLSRMAPLFTLPVQIERESFDNRVGAYRYSIKLKDEGLITNVTLREKLANDFGLVLPPIDDELTPESYFDLVEATIIRNQPRWSLRRQATLALINFTKQAMYEDLDPGNWPIFAAIDKHPVVELFFSSHEKSDAEDSSIYQSEHKIDEISELHQRFPLIYDADSSQHSSIIDIVNGKNLVIEGPPGSGKSQTITNAIAACIANGQKVLFVAEKMAALNVVKNRLDHAGLGDFCLELHSHKTNKLKILSELSNSLSKRREYRLPVGIDGEIERYEGFKLKLNMYAHLINSIYANTGLTIHEIFSRCTKLRQQFSINPDTVKIDKVSGLNYTLSRQKELTDFASMLASIYRQVAEQAENGEVERHYWYGVSKVDLDEISIHTLQQDLIAWNDAIDLLRVKWAAIQGLLQIELVDKTSVTELEDFLRLADELPALVGGEQLSLLPQISKESYELSRWIEGHEKIHQEIQKIEPDIHGIVINKRVVPDQISKITNILQSSGLSDSHTLDDLTSDLAKSKKLVSLAENLEKIISLIRPSAPEGMTHIFSCTTNSLEELVIAARKMQELPVDLYRFRDPIFDNQQLDGLIESLVRRLDNLSPLHTRLSQSVKLDLLPKSATLKALKLEIDGGGFFKWFSSSWRNARKSVLVLSLIPKNQARNFINLLPEIIEYVEQLEEIERINKDNPLLDPYVKGIDTPIHRISNLRSWYKSVRDEYGSGFGERVKVGSAILNVESEFAFALIDEAQRGLIAIVEELIDGLKYFQKIYPHQAISRHRNQPLSGQESELAKFASGLENLLVELSQIFRRKNLTLAEIKSYEIKLENLFKAMKEWSSSQFLQLIQPFGEQLQIETGTFSKQHVDVVKNTLEIVRVFSKSKNLSHSLTSKLSEARYIKIKTEGALLKEIYSEERDKRESFVNRGSIQINDWMKVSCGNYDLLHHRNGLALSNLPWLLTWLDYIKLRNRLLNEGLGSVITELEANEIKPDDFSSAIELACMHKLSNEILLAEPDLVNYTGLELTAIQERFKEYDAKILKLQRQKIAYSASRFQPPTGVSSGRVSEYSETSLILHEANKRSKHIALRSLMKRSGRAVQVLKPCFMMSPMSVAQYLAPGVFNFDLVIMDEASQIRPEDALGSIARGSRLVVVGDPKQLPPTNFFNKVLDEAEDDEMVGMQDSESVLEAVMPMFRTRRLRWHYRSKHESLIAFSNKYFYNSDLVLFPSPFKSSSEFGVHLHKVDRGRFSSRRNVEEAQRLLKLAAAHLIERPSESLGIVAMNSEQRDELEKQLDQLAKDSSLLLEALERNKQTEEPLFIKNLENVQGDERDVIFISLTYGPETIGGRTMQRFGPINSDVGWRRLNVLFTRSKKRMHVFSSMSSSDVLVAQGSSRGVKALKDFLEYAESGHLHQTIRTNKAPDSDFEIAVINSLREYGYECEPQLGVAGFFLDIAVYDPGQPGRYLMGIECDGATYHSAKSARDRDHLRQEILEGLGWRIRRIWSTDWFKHPQAQLKPIIQELESLKTKKLETERVIIKDEFVSSSIKIVSENNEGQADQGLSLRDRLVNFDREIIRSHFPKTEESQRLLRSEILEILLELKPTSKAEFQEYVPSYLRTGTAIYEAKFLDNVLGIVADYA